MSDKEYQGAQEQNACGGYYCSEQHGHIDCRAPQSDPVHEMCDWRKRENGLLCDTDPMPFGKHKGIPMQDVPASYLHWLWVNGKQHDKTCKVADYIRRNISALKAEYSDGIWS